MWMACLLALALPAPANVAPENLHMAVQALAGAKSVARAGRGVMLSVLSNSVAILNTSDNTAIKPGAALVLL
jgi:hypothetical protein